MVCFFEENIWTNVSNVLCFVMNLHFSSLVIRACYMFIKLKAQQGSNKLSNSEKCIIPQEPYMPIFLKPSHKIRILNVNIVYLCVSVCVRERERDLICLRFWISWRILRVRLCEPESVQGLQCRPLGPTLNRHILVASHVHFSSVYSSLVFCEAQMENNRKFFFLPVLRYYSRHECC